MQYHYLGDAIIFDMTYRTNVYDMLFLLLVGMNHHFQSAISVMCYSERKMLNLLSKNSQSLSK
jgi:hypothetical protein